MVREPNTNRNGQPWTEEEILATWNKGTVIPDYDPKKFRLDICGQEILWNQYANRNSDYGWEIDHINPVANGGTDIDSNLQPLNWRTNHAKSEQLNWHCG